jgi:hypothetical protein
MSSAVPVSYTKRKWPTDARDINIIQENKHASDSNVRPFTDKKDSAMKILISSRLKTYAWLWNNYTDKEEAPYLLFCNEIVCLR